CARDNLLQLLIEYFDFW
nr:immunoglobulin heavy chain junction region [Macaca mulatta]MOV40035.1 immunoglobulin heavy chain junction region [Macaca mulatta]MOV40344.1 immunoglobulin heavy chain junction region [Macaca mulatta]MOV40534.1 immunoglobulin heavy chain junction region [Macaca mulatta]MOV40691.1 immunoglobulin heavy chain junction region [Macaca mulatta]